MSITTDGDFTVPSLNGAPQTSLPLQGDQEYNCTLINRSYQQLSGYFSPAMYERFEYTNELTYSDILATSSWTPTNVSVVIDSGVDTEGNGTATLLSETTDDGAHSISGASSIVSGLSYFGVFLKPYGRNYVKISIYNGTDSNLGTTIFNLSNGSVVSGPGGIKRASGGWFWCYTSGTATATNSSTVIEIGSSASTFSYAGTVGTGVLCSRATLISGQSWGPAIITTAATRTVTVPIVDVGDPIAFLVDEEPPDQSGLEVGVAQWSRQYARVSKETVVPSSIIVSRPSPSISGTSGISYGMFFTRSSENEVNYDVYSETDVSFDSGAPSFALTGGSYEIYFDGATSATIAYNATAGVIQSVLNAMPSVSTRGGVAVTGSATSTIGFTINFSSTINSNIVTADLTDITTDGGTAHLFIVPAWYNIVDGSAGQQTFWIRAYDDYGMYNITGGTYTLTLLGQTTSAISFDADATTIAAALNAIPNVAKTGTIILYDSPYGPPGLVTNSERGVPIKMIAVRYRLDLPLFTGRGDLIPQSPITLVFGYDTIVTYLTYTLQLLAGSASRFINAQSHGVVGGDTIFLGESIAMATPSTPATPSTYYISTYAIGITAFSVIDSNTIQLLGGQLDDWMSAATITSVGFLGAQDYIDGPINVRCSKITDYYLPGYTVGIESAADISLAPSQNDGSEFFAALMNGNTINYVVGEIGVWKGPILYATKVTIDPNDLATLNRPSLSVDIIGSGAVYSSPAGIASTISTSARFLRDSTVYLEAVNGYGQVFSQWTGDYTGSAPTISIVLNRSTKITAVFSETQHSGPPPS